MDLATRKIDPITKEFNPSVNFLQWNKGDGCIYFSTNDEDCRNIYRYSPKDRKFEKLNLETDVTSAFAMSENNPSLAAYIGQLQGRSCLCIRPEKENLSTDSRPDETDSGEN